ncbi:uncharacterized protein At1g28695 [Gossypium hirsutum]|uniref:Uncharacterized protein At1g28695 n=1 Tax=Gossypium hirsutum TaxID=3635 RepID=A0ABM2YNE5_GOSHI|nr:uncharacterized protein At1g28695-like [Gossypium hirsutum]
MKGSRRISKPPPYCLIVTLLMFFTFVCLILHQFSYKSNTHSLVHPQHDFERKTLLQALRKASMADRTVILTVVNGNWAKPASILDLFLESFQIGEGTKRLLNHLLIIAEDSQAFQYCNSKHPHCFQLKNFPKIQPRTPRNLMLSPSRVILLTQIVELGYHVAFTNADVMWLRNPLSKLVPDIELSIACELYLMDAETYGISGGGGFFHLKTNERTYQFMKNLNLKRVLYPDSEHQSLCKVSGNNGFIDLIRIKVSYFSENQIYTIQANCCEDIDSKIHDLKLVLDDWRKFKELSANNASSKRSPLSWRAPQKCIA